MCRAIVRGLWLVGFVISAIAESGSRTEGGGWFSSVSSVFSSLATSFSSSGKNVAASNLAQPEVEKTCNASDGCSKGNTGEADSALKEDKSPRIPDELEKQQRKDSELRAKEERVAREAEAEALRKSQEERVAREAEAERAKLEKQQREDQERRAKDERMAREAEAEALRKEAEALRKSGEERVAREAESERTKLEKQQRETQERREKDERMAREADAEALRKEAEALRKSEQERVAREAEAERTKLEKQQREDQERRAKDERMAREAEAEALRKEAEALRKSEEERVAREAEAERVSREAKHADAGPMSPFGSPGSLAAGTSDFYSGLPSSAHAAQPGQAAPSFPTSQPLPAGAASLNAKGSPLSAAQVGNAAIDALNSMRAAQPALMSAAGVKSGATPIVGASSPFGSKGNDGISPFTGKPSFAAPVAGGLPDLAGLQLKQGSLQAKVGADGIAAVCERMSYDVDLEPADDIVKHVHGSACCNAAPLSSPTDRHGCCQRCHGSEACEVFVWQPSSGACWLMQYVDKGRRNNVPARDRVSGPRPVLA